MPRIVFIGDVHNEDKSIAGNYARYTKNYGNIGEPFILLLEVDYDGDPESSSDSAIKIVTASKPSQYDTIHYLLN